MARRTDALARLRLVTHRTGVFARFVYDYPIDARILRGMVRMANIVVVGGGLAGLSTAGLLAARGHRVTLLEKMEDVGGRALTQERDGFRLNFGAHAVYARDRSALRSVLERLGVAPDFVVPDMDQVRYITPAGKETGPPVSVRRLMQGGLLPKVCDKGQFARAVFQMAVLRPGMDFGESMEEWMGRKGFSRASRELLLHMVATNFFTGRPQDVSLATVVRYYRRVLRTRYPVSYIRGGWGRLVDLLRARVEQLGVRILTKTGGTGLEFDGQVLQAVRSRAERFAADAFVLCIPPSALLRLAKGSALAPEVMRYAEEPPSMALVYDVALRRRVGRGLSYVNDMERRVFITDPSAYDPSCAPPGGQLLQAIAYAPPGEADDEAALARRRTEVEALYDAHFPGWRDELVFSRVIDQAQVQAIGWGRAQRRLPLHVREFPNVFFAGDWCAADGSVSDVAFHSALQAAALVGPAASSGALAGQSDRAE